MREDFDTQWRELAEDVMVGMKEWRLQHPKATWREIERALDERWSKARARMLQDLALASTAADIQAAQEQDRPVCPKCNAPLVSDGRKTRHLVTRYNQEVVLERSHGICPACGECFFPLDDELELLSGELTPGLQEDLVHLGTWMPFERAAKEFKHFTHTDVSRPTVERITEAAGTVYVQIQEREVERLERETPAPPAGAAKQFLSVDGAFVPLVGGEWAEVKTMVIGDVQPPVRRRGETVIETHNLSYFSRLADSDTFQRLALVETHRRGVERAGQVGAVTDGAEWIQSFVDFHRRDALRILDFPHAGERVAQIGQAKFGEDTPEMKTWLTQQLHQLKHTGPVAVLAELRLRVESLPQSADLMEHLTYLEKREDLLQYPQFQAAGWPIGDGAVESGNKLVVEARLKGSGMHWARSHVNSMLALRNVACNDRWDEAWPQIALALRQQDRLRRRERRKSRHALRQPQPQPVPEPYVVNPAPPKIVTVPQVRADPQSVPANTSAETKPTGPWRPPANHPWRHMPLGKARFKPHPGPPDPKT